MTPEKKTNSAPQIWVVEDDQSLRWVLGKTFESASMQVRCFEDAYEALEALEEGEAPQVLLTDIRMPGMDGLTFLKKVHEQHPNMPIIVMTAHSDLDSAVSSYQTGAFEYLPKPFDIDDAVKLVQRAFDHQVQQQDKIELNVNPGGSKIIGESPAMQELYRAIGRLSHSNITVLINGQSGTGKELVAAALHEHSPRKNNPFIALNMAAIPSDLIEAELFGHEKGAFTGATAKRSGRFEQANGGTLFLDEIGDMPFATQTRLLRVLADGEVYRVGGHTPIRVDVRIIAATHQNLEQRVEDGKFREDLFYRLNVIRLNLPALKERSGDIPKLAEFFLSESAKQMDIEAKSLSDQALKRIVDYPWPGNVRELQNTCRWLMVMAPSAQIALEDLPAKLLEHGSADTTASTERVPSDQLFSSDSEGQVLADSPNPVPTTWQQKLHHLLIEQHEKGDLNNLIAIQEQIEQELINTALELSGGKKGAAADLLGWGRNTLTRKLKH